MNPENCVDNLLIKIYNHFGTIGSNFPHKDQKILSSLHKQLTQGLFLTENQGKLLIKILKENLNSILIVEPEVKKIINNPSWSKTFRIIPKIRKIYQKKEHPDQLRIEFTYDKRLKNKLLEITTEFDGNISSVSGREYSIPFTEKNIFLLVDQFLHDDFDIDEKILDFYHEISKILENKKINFDILSVENQFIKIKLAEEIGRDNVDDLLLLQDRKIRYQYQILSKKSENSLENSIACRKNAKVFIDSQIIGLDKVIESLKKLKRLPLLTVFDGYDIKTNKKSLDCLHLALKENEISENIGIFFRFDKDKDVLGFNSDVSRLGYNKDLTDSTTVAGIANNKIPKFMIKMNWKPKSIISFTNNFKNNKTHAYCSDVDLIIYYGDKKPLIGDIDVIL